MKNLKNYLLVSATLLIGHLPKLYFDAFPNVKWAMGVIIERPTRPDYWIMHYSWAVNFFILTYCFYYSKGVSRGAKRFILIVASLDIIHLILFSKQGFGVVKVGVAILIYWMHHLLKDKIKKQWL